MTKGVVFGAGFLGTRIGEWFGYRIVPRSEIDVTDIGTLKIFLEREMPEVVINAVGKTGRPNTDWCEEHKEETVKSNVEGAKNLAEECFERKIYFVNLGSGGIYYGNNDQRGFTEEDEPNMQGQFYILTKILAERALREFPCLQLRLNLPIDDRPHERNLIDKLRAYPRLINIQNSMTTVPHMLPAMKILIERKRIGVYNFTNPGTISAAEIMEMYRAFVDPNQKFEALSLEELDKITKGKRSNCYLNTSKIENELRETGAEMPEIHKAVEECLMRYSGHLQR